MCSSFDQLSVVLAQNRHVNPVVCARAVVVLGGLLPNLAEESLLHFTKERARVSSCVCPVHIWVFDRVPFPWSSWDNVHVVQRSRRCCERPSHHAPWESFLIFPAAATHARVTPILLNPCSKILALELEPRPELIPWKPNRWISSLTKVGLLAPCFWRPLPFCGKSELGHTPIPACP